MKVDQEPLSKKTIKRIEDGLKYIKEGRYYIEEEVAAELGIRE